MNLYFLPLSKKVLIVIGPSRHAIVGAPVNIKIEDIFFVRHISKRQEIGLSLTPVIIVHNHHLANVPNIG